MSTTVFIPSCNPTKFYLSTEPEKAFHASIPSHETALHYNQKVQDDDVYYLLFGVDAGVNWTFLCHAIDCDGNEVKEFTISTVEQTVTTDYDYNQILVDWSTLAEGIYQIKLELTSDQNDVYTLYSEPHYLKDEWAGTILIKYANESNNFDVPFEEWGQSFYLRVEGGFPSEGYTPASKDTIYVDQVHNAYLLESKPYVVQKLQLAGPVGIPNWLIKIINMALSCTDLYLGLTITGEFNRYSKAEGAKLEPVRLAQYPLSGWAVDLQAIPEDFSEELAQSMVFILGYPGDMAFQAGDGTDYKVFRASDTA